ncbi:DUF4126 domain-containing protein [Deinococcus irradiatisoli]|uniref:DUF4126 domain-containing protein n=1 Tax=Deinococcus irradiatisoli TaxID=2202254 RepID=A0A2Z3JBB2_9DEIO|nr:DUF4126 domain-containing protein [Deinococcus irradiatisoli]AWN22443.1 DUF4126 domain-containing protein [Deinococcus irradiatisoli]
MELISGLLTSLGLSSAAGLNAYLPLLIVGLLQRFGVVPLPETYALLGHPAVLAGLAVLGTLDFIGDKVPGLDHALHLFGGVIHAASGAVLFASHAGLTHLSPAASLLLGLLVAGSVHLGRAAVRPASTALTGGLGNPVLSAAEDATSLTLSLSALFAPLLAGVLLLGTLFAGWRLWRRRVGRRRMT